MGYADLIVQAGKDPQSQEYAFSILEASDNAAIRVRELLTFARKKPLEKRPLDPYRGEE